MGWQISEKGFRIVLSAAVPDIARTRLAPDVDAFLAAEGLARARIERWICHPGGPKVLRAMQEVDADPAATLMVGDTTYDIEMARNAGVGAIGVGWGYHAPQRLVQAGAHAVVDGSDALIAAIDARLAVQERGT